MAENKPMQKDKAAQQGIGVRQLRNRNQKEASIQAIHDKLNESPELQAFFDRLAVSEDGKNRKNGISKDEFMTLAELPIDELTTVIEKLRQSKGNFKAVLREAMPDHESKANVILPAYVNQKFNELSRASGIPKAEIFSKIITKFYNDRLRMIDRPGEWTTDDIEIILLMAGIEKKKSQEEIIKDEFESILRIIGKSTIKSTNGHIAVINKREARKAYKQRKKEFIEKYGNEWAERFKEYE